MNYPLPDNLSPGGTTKMSNFFCALLKSPTSSMSKEKNVKQRKCPTNVQLFSKMTVRRIRRVRPSDRRLQRLIIKQCIWRRIQSVRPSVRRLQSLTIKHCIWRRIRRVRPSVRRFRSLAIKQSKRRIPVEFDRCLIPA